MKLPTTIKYYKLTKTINIIKSYCNEFEILDAVGYSIQTANEPDSLLICKTQRVVVFICAFNHNCI
jgi:hypothetical protein